MTYKEKFDNCKTLGEARRMRVTLMDEASSNEEIARTEIKRAYEERKREIQTQIYTQIYGDNANETRSCNE